MQRTKTFTVTYNYFEPGDLVTPTSTRCPLDPGVYKVEMCFKPAYPGDECIVHIEGHQYGVSSEYLREASSE
jgi:hypothetical protein